ncbi:MAG TPA: glycogen/starch synthase, partial [Chitinophagaceae bacterium]
RERVYGYDDDTERFISFQIAVCDWLSKWQHKPDVVHVHDHHTGLIPFMLKYCFAFNHFADVPTVFTIHNAQYQGSLGWDKSHYIPAWDTWKGGLLEWNRTINPLAAAVKNAWKVTTVSHSYLRELTYMSNGLEPLFEYEKGKCVGILNGIDTDVWNPSTDHFIVKNYDAEKVEKGKQRNKREICGQFGLDPEKPLFVFVGRLVGEKAADLLPESISSSIYQHHGNCNFLVLGSGETQVEGQLEQLKHQFAGYVNTYIGYSEQLSHQLYAGADFLLMPSRIEPCGLNQMYALRYGTVPVVRSVGGLIDTVKDFGEPQGFGIRFDKATVGDIIYSVGRAVDLFYHRKNQLAWMQQYMMGIDHSWEASARDYIALYQSQK